MGYRILYVKNSALHRGIITKCFLLVFMYLVWKCWRMGRKVIIKMIKKQWRFVVENRPDCVDFDNTFTCILGIWKWKPSVQISLLESLSKAGHTFYEVLLYLHRTLFNLYLGREKVCLDFACFDLDICIYPTLKKTSSRGSLSNCLAVIRKGIKVHSSSRADKKVEYSSTLCYRYQF